MGAHQALAFGAPQPLPSSDVVTYFTAFQQMEQCFTSKQRRRRRISVAAIGLPASALAWMTPYHDRTPAAAVADRTCITSTAVVGATWQREQMLRDPACAAPVSIRDRCKPAAGAATSRAVADNVGMGVQQRPVLLVVKKNASILRNLNTWVREILAARGDTESRPLLGDRRRGGSGLRRYGPAGV
jgi:hypothetical protein